MKNLIKKSLVVALIGCGFSTSVAAQQNAQVCEAQQNRPTELVGQRVGKKVGQAFELYSQEDIDGALAILMDIEPKKAFDKAYTNRFIGNLMAAKGGDATKKSVPYLVKAYEANILNATEHADVIKLLAQLYMMNEEYQKSINMYNEWMNFTCKEDAATYSAIASGYYFLKQMGKVISPADKAIALYEKPNKQPYQLKMTAYYERKMYKQAVKVLEEMVVVFPTEGPFWTRLGYLYLLTEDYKNAMATLELAYNQGFLTKEGEIKTLASLYSQQGMPYQAGKLLVKNMDKGLVKKEAKVYSSVANSFHSSKDLKSAAKYYGIAAKMEKDAELYRKQGVLLLQAQSYKAAAVALKKALELGSSKKGAINMALMESYFYRGDFKNAHTYVKAAAKDRKTSRNAKAWEPYIKEKANNRGIKL